MRDEIERLNFKCKPLERKKYLDFVKKYALTAESGEREEKQNGQIPGNL